MSGDRCKEAALYLSMVDLTSLDAEKETEESIRTLCVKARSPPVHAAAVCVFPKWIALAKSVLGDSEVSIATVVNFPEGRKSAGECAAEIKTAKSDGVDEIDFVIDWRKFAKDFPDSQTELASYIGEMVSLCRPCRTKVILETSQLTSKQIAAAARIAIPTGVDFLKTSTGKVAGGASVDALRVFAEEIKSSGKRVGIKPSGGIRSFEDCRALHTAVTEILGQEHYTTKELFRFGASSVRDQLLDVIDEKGTKTAGVASATADSTPVAY